MSEVLDLVGDRIKLNIEVKGEKLGDQGIEASIAQLVRSRQIQGDVVISSFNPLSLRRVRRIAPELQRGLLYSPHMPFYLSRAWSRRLVGADALHPHYTMVDAAYMRWARRRGYRVNVWTVDDEPAMRGLISLGVDGIITNHPEKLRSLLSR